MKATLSFRGRNWTAWYATDIPLPYGPWKFQGLPGLIMEMEDDTGAHVYKLASLNTDTSNQMIILTQETQKVQREEYLKKLRYMHKEGGISEVLKGYIVNGSSKPKKLKKHFYVPLELE